jgi:hypothetical protein
VEGTGGGEKQLVPQKSELKEKTKIKYGRKPTGGRLSKTIG